MQDLPLELQEKILLEASPSQLDSFCFLSHDLYSLCSSSSFWRRKFSYEGISPSFQSLLPSPRTPTQWIYTLTKSLQAEEEVREALRILSKPNKLIYSLGSLLSLKPLFWLGLENEYLEEIWKKQKEMEYLTTLRYEGLLSEKEYMELSGDSHLYEGEIVLLSSSDYTIHIWLEAKEYFRIYSFPLSPKEMEMFLFLLYFYKKSP